MEKLSELDFIEKAKAIHADKYDYSKVNYVNSRSKIILSCKQHGDFLQQSNNHLQGAGCPQCGKQNAILKKTYNLIDFIEKAKAVHGDKYSYDKTEYKKSELKVIITCKKHGDFLQQPSSHLQGIGCKQCGVTEAKKILRSTLKQFVTKAKAIHADKYDYSKVNYINNNVEISIGCQKHGFFKQIPSNHLQGAGCSKCRYEKNSYLFRKNTEQFISEAKAVHGDKYNYDKTEYISANKKVIITCPFHGDFYQKPSRHLCDRGCTFCKRSKAEEMISEILIKNNIKYKLEYSIPNTNNLYRYDFYLPEYKTLIEFHGIQHYEYIPFFHRNGEDDFLAQKNRDDVKRDLTVMFNYRLLEFNYKQFKKLKLENFEKLIITKIKGL